MNTEKEKRAIDYLKLFEPEEEAYYGCYSGGKDSDVIRILLSLANVKHELPHKLTTVDAPETVNYVKGYKDIIIDRPKRTMWQLIVDKKFPPTRLARYCCEELKERGGQGRLKVTGVRWAESNARTENGGLVKIIGKPKTVMKTAEEAGANFIKTDKGGGGIKLRRYRDEKGCRAMLPYHIHYDKSDHRLDGRGRMGVFTLLRMRIKPAVSMRI